ncbi:MAG: xanthine dehydrogenase family protein molybdopterin-binding subunit [Dehalococcoidia bacterium]|nr:xanthine dehydrogenase family protein molybdopterin-binding subunit [Dehalococcoidia bacterium]
MNIVGGSPVRVDARPKVTGQAAYAGDLRLPGMLHAVVLRSPFPHARLRTIETQAARELPGVRTVLTFRDVPEVVFEPLDEATDGATGGALLLGDIVRHVGDEVAVVAADDLATAREAAALIEIEYEPLPYVLDAELALKSGAPLIHGGQTNLVGNKPIVLERGNVGEGLQQAELTFKEKYCTQYTSGSPMEPRVVVTRWENETLTVWKAGRGVFLDREQLARTLAIPAEQVHVITPVVGASYGNKDESRAAALTAILSRELRRPVRLEFTREEELVFGRLRHPATIELTIGVQRDGSITAIDNLTTMNTGPYVPGAYVIRRSGHASTYLYRCPNVRFEGNVVYTNSYVAGSYRGLGAPQAHFALESLIDTVAEGLGIDPLEYRIRNVVGPEGQPGQRQSDPNVPIPPQPVEGGIPFSSNGLRQCLEEGSLRFGWRAHVGSSGVRVDGPRKRGIGCAAAIYQTGQLPAEAVVRLSSTGCVQLLMGTVDVGQGSNTVLAQIVAEALKVPFDAVDGSFADTDETPFSHGTFGSSTTFSSGSAAKAAADAVVSQLKAFASRLLGLPEEKLEWDGSAVRQVTGDQLISLSELLSSLGLAQVEGKAQVQISNTTHIVNAFATHFVEVEVDIELGTVQVMRIVAAHDCGYPIHRNAVESQIRGGVIQAIGYALQEQMLINPSGRPYTGSFVNFRLPRTTDVPVIEPMIVDIVDPIGPYGAKAVGEPAVIPTAAAIANAVYDATGVRITELPITPARLLAGILRMEEE